MTFLASSVAAQESSGPPPVHEVRPDGADSTSRPVAEPTPFDPADLPPEKPPAYRFAGGIGLQLNLANDALAGYGNDVGGGLHFSAVAAPYGWPALFGLALGLETYGGPQSEGVQYRLTSYYVLAAVRLQPDHWSVRPRLDLLGGMWGLDLGTPGAESSAIIDAGSTVGGRVTPAGGLAVGLDFVFGHGPNAGYGWGFAVQLLGGGNMTLPDPYGAGQRESSAIGQLMFMVDVVGVSKSPGP